MNTHKNDTLLGSFLHFFVFDGQGQNMLMYPSQRECVSITIGLKDPGPMKKH